MKNEREIENIKSEYSYLRDKIFNDDLGNNLLEALMKITEKKSDSDENDLEDVGDYTVNIVSPCTELHLALKLNEINLSSLSLYSTILKNFVKRQKNLLLPQQSQSSFEIDDYVRNIKLNSLESALKLKKLQSDECSYAICRGQFDDNEFFLPSFDMQQEINELFCKMNKRLKKMKEFAETKSNSHETELFKWLNVWKFNVKKIKKLYSVKYGGGGDEEIDEKSNPLESVVDISNSESLTIPVNFDDDIKPTTESPEITNNVHELGYENVVQIVELVKQEEAADIDVLDDVKENTENLCGKNTTEETNKEKENILNINPIKADEKIIEEKTDEKNDVSTQKKETTEEVLKIEPVRPPEVTKRVKPAVSEKPKDLIRLGKSGFVKSSSINIESKPPTEDSNVKCDVIDSKSRIKLVERRKSELMSFTESADKDGNTETKSFKKESATSGHHVPVSADFELKEHHYQKKIESPHQPQVEETPAVLRKKSITDRSGEQPELMKVFARRSLKVREYEKAVDDGQKSRDSDKENEILEQSKGGDGKKGFSDEREKSGEDVKRDEEISKGNNKIGCEVKVNITSLKPEIQSRKNVIQKYGRSLSENNVKKVELDKSLADELNENKMNRIMNKMEVIIGTNRGKGEEIKKDNDDENDCCSTGFKRIQQRKAEWERRAQQSAN